MYASNFDMNLECVEAEMISGSPESFCLTIQQDSVNIT